MPIHRHPNCHDEMYYYDGTITLIQLQLTRGGIHSNVVATKLV
jgi:hypothetical protein